VMKAQYSAAEAQVRISEAATGVGEQMADVGLAMQRAADKTEQMRARADAVSELEAAGTFDDLTTLGPGQDDIDRQLSQLSSSTPPTSSCRPRTSASSKRARSSRATGSSPSPPDSIAVAAPGAQPTGSRARTAVPSPTGLVTTSRPPSASTRSASPRSPEPPL